MLIPTIKKNTNCQKKYYNKNYLSDKECHKFSDMQKFDAERYAKWFRDNYALSSFKSLREVAREVTKRGYRVSPETISRIAREGDQLYTDNPSRPKIGLVDALSDLFGQPRDKGRWAAGWASENSPIIQVENGQEFLEVLEMHNLPIPHFAHGIKGLEKVGKEELNRVLELLFFQLGQKAKEIEDSQVP